MTNVLRSPYPVSSVPVLVTAGMIFGYALSEGSGQSLNDLSPNNYDAFLGTSASADGRDPDWHSAGLTFVSGNFDVVTVSGVPDSGFLGAMTVQIVAQLTSAGNTAHFLSKHTGSGSTANPIDFRTNSTPAPQLVLNRANTGQTTFTGPATTINSWRCYAVVTSADIRTAPTFYVGATATTGTVSGTPAGTVGPPTGSAANVALGTRPDGGARMTGQFGYVLVYNRALSAAEIAQNYDYLKPIMAARGVTLP